MATPAQRADPITVHDATAGKTFFVYGGTLVQDDSTGQSGPPPPGS